MSRFNLLFSIGILCCAFGYSQDAHMSTVNNYAPSILSPNAAALVKSIDFPVNLYTGQTNISIPVYTLKDGDIELPIVLNYNPGGIQVAEEATWVGLGWSLSVGGQITRAVKGKDDAEIFTDWSYLENPIWFRPDFKNIDYLDNCSLETPTGTCYGLCAEEFYLSPFTIVADIQKGYIMPDCYYYSALGVSEKFFKDFRDSKFYFEKPQNIRITQNMDLYTAITDNGTTLNFNELEEKTYWNNGEYGKASVTSYLTNLRTPTGRMVNFTYTKGSEQSITPVDGESISCMRGYDIPTTNYSTITYTYTPTYPSIIESPNYKIEFISAPRTDLPGEKRLIQIIVTDKINNTTRTFNFDNNDYFIANDGTDKRLKLNDFYETGMPKYVFSYNPLQLPNKKSKSIDYWGFYNGITNTGLIPDFHKLAFYTAGYNNDNDLLYLSGTANRGSNANTIQACMLQKITYPTGGYAEFQFEPHTFSNYLYEEANYPQYYIFKDYENKTRPSTTSYLFDVPDSITSVQVYYQINNGECTDLNVSGYLQLNEYYGPVILSKSKAVGENSIDGTFTFTPKQKTYYLELHLEGTCDDNNHQSARVFVRVTYNYRPVHTFTQGAGLRIKRIRQVENTASGAQETVKRYVYEYNSSGKILSYGRIRTPLKFFQKDEVKICSVNGSGVLNTEYRNRYQISSNNLQIEFNRTNGSMVGYDKVLEYIDENGKNGYTLYSYYNADADLSQYYIPSLNNGLEYDRKYYDANNNLKKHVTSQYWEFPYHNFYEAHITDNYIGPESLIDMNSHIIFPGRYCGRMHIEFYPLLSQKILLWTQEVEDLYENGSSLKTNIQYSYDPNYYQLVSQTETRSDGKSQVTSMSYPNHLAYGTNIYKQMTDANIIAEPVKTETYVQPDNTMVEGILIDYRKEGSIFLKNVIKKAEASTYVDKVIFDTYNSQGDIVQMHNADDLFTTYIWGYNNSLPIAKCVNANTGQIAYTSFETSNDKGYWTFSGAPTFSLTSKTGNWYYQLSRGVISRSLSAGKYRLTYYANIPVTVTGGSTASTTESTADANGWKLYTKEITFTSAGNLQLSGTAIVDEIRVCPADGQITTYTYEPMYGITTANDPDNLINYYQYDALGRLLRILDNDKKVLKEYKYHYRAQ
jgi:YD repeat-containing protein